ncbi:MAG: HAD family hydrolase [Bacillota bacterium]|nr:HAD family hydrolase [Bacillota bacterium]
MLKLVACDVDGTLLPHGHTQISDEIVGLIKEITDKKIIFAVASGRPYHNLKWLFEKVEDRIFFIPSDGAMILHNEKILYKKAIQPFAMVNTVKPLIGRDSLSVVLAGKYISYVMSEDKEFKDKLRHDNRNHIIEVSRLDEIEEDVYKISVYGSAKSAFSRQIMSGRHSDMLDLIYEDNGWTEFVAKGVNKALALKYVMKSLKAPANEIVVIGDNINDVEMLKLTGNSRAVAGHPEAERAAGSIVENAEEILRIIARKGDLNG